MKKKIILFSSIGGAILIGITVLIICLCLSKVDKSYRTIKVFKVDGTVNVKRGSNTQAAAKDMKLKNDDVVEVMASSSTVLKLDNDKYVMAKENTTFRLIATGKDNNTKTRILVDKGGVIVEVKEKLKDNESFEMASSNSVMAIRGTQISFDVEVKDNKITTSFAILDGNTEILLFKNDKLSSTTLSKDFRMSYTTDVTDVSAEDISKLVDKVGKVVDVINDNDLKEVFNVVKEELTSEEIDSIVDAINDFEREEKVNGVIKFKNDVSKLQYGIDPTTVFVPDKEYSGIKYYYSETINGEYSLYDSSTTLNVGTSWYFKAISDDAYRSDPFLVEIEQQQLNLTINLSQNIHTMSVTSADIIVSIVDDEFFNSDAAKEVDENMQPVNYIVCKARYYDIENTEKYYWGELNYRNKEIVFDRSIFADQNARNEVTPTIEFEYHINSNYEVTNEASKQYEFVDQFVVDNMVVYYDYIANDYYFSFEKGAFTADESISPSYFSNYYSVYFEDSIYSTNRTDFGTDEDNRHEISLDGKDSDGDGIIPLYIKALNGSGDLPVGAVFEKTVNVDTNLLADKVVDYPMGYSRPYLNIGKQIYTFNSDGTINLYIDLQNGIEMYEDPDDLKLGDYLVIYSTQDGSMPDKYVRGNGRFLILENIPFADYIIKDVFAVSEVKDGITYALAHEENDRYIDLVSDIITMNDATQTDYGIGNTVTVEGTVFAGDTFTIISSSGEESYANETIDTDNYYSDDNSIIIKGDRLISMYAEDYEDIIDNSDYTTEYMVSLDETNFNYLKDYMKEHHNIDIKGYAEGEFAFKIYFKVTGEML